MGQYLAIYNLDKEQVIQPGRFNDGQRLREFGSASCGVLLALTAVLAHGNEQGGIRSDHEMIEPGPVAASPLLAITPIVQAFRKTWRVSPISVSISCRRCVRMRP
jgi:hypothetical protein